MARPSSFSDVDAWRRSDDNIASIDLTSVELSAKTALVYVKVAELGELLEACGLKVEMSGAGLKATRAKSPLELTRMLEAEQKSWDEARKKYLEAIQDPASIENDWLRQSIDRHAKNEGMPPVEWPAEPEEEDDED
ncbi:hypothetical protein AUR04nite_00050 [Glutamicibacter uratoxydans]|uniref:Uncharacterized protein n=1 Tax=Glutamicibacter uratoxydans TaxID=43667 RepID=A0A4Y4DIV7_GLUUR|nr:hypothetical protein [Glutamicibacter uratoxydans]GED04473.1 hypothetical protein AUR04nite_00050 [Glutamicibacter uratoxydans]